MTVSNNGETIIFQILHWCSLSTTTLNEADKESVLVGRVAIISTSGNLNAPSVNGNHIIHGFHEMHGPMTVMIIHARTTFYT